MAWKREKNTIQTLHAIGEGDSAEYEEYLNTVSRAVAVAQKVIHVLAANSDRESDREGKISLLLSEAWRKELYASGVSKKEADDISQEGFLRVCRSGEVNIYPAGNA